LKFDFRKYYLFEKIEAKSTAFLPRPFPRSNNQGRTRQAGVQKAARPERTSTSRRLQKAEIHLWKRPSPPDLPTTVQKKEVRPHAPSMARRDGFMKSATRCRAA
jgi:hypothetical protein